jgi:hypothetical protein
MEADDWCGQFKTDEERSYQITLIRALRDGVYVDPTIQRTIRKDLDELIERGVKAVPPPKRGYYDRPYTRGYRNEVFHARNHSWHEDDLFGGAHCDCKYAYFFDGQEVSLENWCLAFLKEVGNFPRFPGYNETDERVLKAFYDKYLAFRSRWYAKKVLVCDNCKTGEHLPHFRYRDLDLEWEHVMVANRDLTLDEWDSVYKECLASIPPAKEIETPNYPAESYEAPVEGFWKRLFGGV